MSKQLMDQLVKESQRTVPVGAICNGTVIDHIPAGSAIRLIYLLQLADHDHAVTVGMNLPSKRLGTKDLIKIEGWIVNPEMANQIAVFAPGATLNIVKEYRVAEKIVPKVPHELRGIIKCPNAHCITNHELANTVFLVENMGRKNRLRCHHCEKAFSCDQILLVRQEESAS